MVSAGHADIAKGADKRRIKGKMDLVDSSKMRMTKQRQVILDVLRARNVHPTADALYAMVREQLPKISLGTVYRNLEILTALGEIQTLELSGSQKRYDGVAQKHYHIRCLHCGRVDDAPIAPLNRLEDDLYKSTVYTIMGHRLEFIGLCPECSKDKAAREAAEQAFAASSQALSQA
jgi:Fe2+ or Zn2+ uptake regulation protein